MSVRNFRLKSSYPWRRSSANWLEIQKLQIPETMKNKPPNAKAMVVPTEPETGTPLAVEGMALRVETSLEAVAGVALGVADAVAVGVGVVAGNGLPLPKGWVVSAWASCLVADWATKKVTVLVTNSPVFGSL